MYTHAPTAVQISTVSSLARPEGLSGPGAEGFGRRESVRAFITMTAWTAGFLGGGYLVFWKPLFDRWLF